jgi:hypothetical protein
MLFMWATRATGDAGKDFEVDSSLARDREIRLTTASLLLCDEVALVALAGWLVIGQVSPCSSSASLLNDSNADYLNP